MPSLTALAATSLSLSTDAFAASVARGTGAPDRGLLPALRLGAIFGTTEGLMCLGGFVLAASLGTFVGVIDHWIALVLLTVIGGRMIQEGVDRGAEEDAPVRRRTFLGTVTTAIGTSIDAAAVGAALALAAAPLGTALIVGVTSFLASSIGFGLGPIIGLKFGKRAEIGGGAVLILIGVTIFVQHMTA